MPAHWFIVASVRPPCGILAAVMRHARGLLAASFGASSPDKPRTRASSKAVKVKSLSLVNPMPVLKAKLQQVVANKVTTKATAVDAKFKRKAQSLCDSVAVLVKARDAVEFESLLEDFDIYKKISMPRKLESRIMQVIWVIARGKVTISLEDFSATPRKKK